LISTHQNNINNELSLFCVTVTVTVTVTIYDIFITIKYNDMTYLTREPTIKFFTKNLKRFKTLKYTCFVLIWYFIFTIILMF